MKIRETLPGARVRANGVALVIALVLLITALGAVGFRILRGSTVGGRSVHVLAVAGLIATALVLTLVALRRVLADKRSMRALIGEVRESEQRFSDIVALAADAIISVGEDQSILTFNRGAEETFGWRAADVIGKPLNVLLPQRMRDSHERHVAHFGETGETARRMGERQGIVGLKRDGTEFPAEASISRLETGGRTLYSVVLRDMTEPRRQLLDERFLSATSLTLSTSLDYESTLVSAVHVAIPHLADCCVLDLVIEGDATRRIVSVHDDPDRTRQLRELEHRRKPLSDSPFPVATVLASAEAVVATDLPPDWWRQDASSVDLSALAIQGYAVLPLVARGRAVGALTLLSTDRNRSLAGDSPVVQSAARILGLAIDNAALYREARRASEARDEVLGIVSHDLRNPLAAISMCARGLRAAAEGTANDGNELIDAIQQSAAMMNALIQDLLDISALESGHLRVDPEAHEAGPLAEQAYDLLSGSAAEKNLAFEVSLPADIPPVRVDATRFVQVLSNLLGNAVKFTEPGGEVSLTADVEGEFVRFKVRDTGPGIPAGQLHRVFDRHWQEKRAIPRGGTGLGLTIARGIVEAHGGSIFVDSTEGVGSTFSFTVPRADR